MTSEVIPAPTRGTTRATSWSMMTLSEQARPPHPSRAEVARDCRAALLEFLVGRLEGARELGAWVRGAYARATRHAATSSPDLVELPPAKDAAVVVAFTRSVVKRSIVRAVSLGEVPCRGCTADPEVLEPVVPADGRTLWLPVARPHVLLVDRVGSLACGYALAAPRELPHLAALLSDTSLEAR